MGHSSSAMTSSITNSLTYVQEEIPSPPSRPDKCAVPNLVETTKNSHIDNVPPQYAPNDQAQSHIHADQQTSQGDVPERDTDWTRRRVITSLFRTQDNLYSRRASLAQAQSKLNGNEEPRHARRVARRARRHAQTNLRDESRIRELGQEVEASKSVLKSTTHMSARQQQARKGIITDHIQYMQDLTTMLYTIRSSDDADDVKRTNLYSARTKARKHLRLIMLYVPTGMAGHCGLEGEFERVKAQLECATATCFTVNVSDKFLHTVSSEPDGPFPAQSTGVVEDGEIGAGEDTVAGASEHTAAVRDGFVEP